MTGSHHRHAPRAGAATRRPEGRDASPAPSGPDRPVVVLLPGMLCSARLWQGQTERLARDADVRIVELTAGSIAEMVDEVLALPHRRFALIGLSLGGIVAMAVARAAPSRVGALALLSTNARPPRPDQRAGWDAMAARTRAGGLADVVSQTLLPLLVHPRRMADPAIAEMVMAMAEDVGPAVFLQQLAAQRSRVDLRPELPQLRCPALVVAGADDALAPVDAHREIADLVPGARLRVLSEAGHLTPLEVPGALGELLGDWVAGVARSWQSSDPASA